VHRGGGIVIDLIIEHWSETGAHVMFDMVGEHAQQDVGAREALLQCEASRESR
jgi:hypothetical protein